MNKVLTAKVCIPHSCRDFYDYEIKNNPPEPGMRVQVSFQNKTKTGVVLSTGWFEQPNFKLKPIDANIDQKPLLPLDILNLCQWVASYYQAPLSEVLPLAMPKRLRMGEIVRPPPAETFKLVQSKEAASLLISKRAIKQLALLDFLTDRGGHALFNELRAQGFTRTHIKPLEMAGILICEESNPDIFPKGDGNENPLILNAEQNHAVDTISARLQAYHCFLLQGVTGSGKTEVYMHIIAEVLKQGRKVLLLVPEIGLTPQLLSRFKARFREPIAVLHSHLNETERALAWQAAAEGQVNLVIGTRSAVFTPLPDLGLILIDEEHDGSFKQMNGVRYSARDTALVRAQKANIPVVLGSATPSLETLQNCMQQKYSLLKLNQKALSRETLQFQLIDLRNHVRKDGLSEPALQGIAKHLKEGHQVLVFINRRGYAPVLLCTACGWMAGCRSCDSHLTLHKTLGKLICHHCGLAQKYPVCCNACQHKELIAIGSGTQRLEQILSQRFPEAGLIRVDRDEINKKTELDRRLEAISSGKAKLIVATQMLAKGHHFPDLTLVVVVDADTGFYNQDFRALEQLGQLLTQVAGRAGRAHLKGQVLIQTHLPQHPLLNTLIREGYEPFAQALLQERLQAELPPFHYLALIRAKDRHEDKILSLLQKIKQFLSKHPVKVLGPAPAPMSKKANQYRMQLLLKSPSRMHLQNSLTAMREWINADKIAQGVQWNVDVDPQDMA